MSEGVQPLTHKFLALLRNYREPVTDAEVREYFQAEGQGEYEKLPSVLNVLMSEGKIKIFQKGNVLSYGVIGAEEAERIRGLTLEQRLVLQEIERAGNKGVWTRDIKTHTNIPQQIVTKTLRLLETRRLVKSVKSISSKNKKLYMLFDLVPSTEITGGPWYNEQEFDHVFIDTLSTFVYEVVKASGTSTLNAITDKVHASGISKVALGPEEIRSIIQTLMYDGRVEEVRAVRLTPGASHETKYKVSHDISTFNYLSETPCGVCPFQHLYHSTSKRRPITAISTNRMPPIDISSCSKAPLGWTDRMHQQAHADAAAPPLSLMRINAPSSSSRSAISATGHGLRSSSAHLLTPTMSAAFASSSSSSAAAGAHADARGRGYPMTPVLTASFPSQPHGAIDPERDAASSFPHSSSSSMSAPRTIGSSGPRLRLNHERHTPQWFTAAPLLTQFYSQSSSAPPPAPRPSVSHQQHRMARLVPPAAPSTCRLTAATPQDSHRVPTSQPPAAADALQRQQRQSPLPPSHVNANAPGSSSPEPPPLPPKKRKRAPAFRLRNFLCMHPGCGKSFTDNAHLRDHTFVHTGEKNLSCELCGKSFARLSTLHDHQRVHSGEKPYVCALPGCAKRYSSRAALRFHIAGHGSTNRSVARRNAAELDQGDGRHEPFPQSAAHHHYLEVRQSPPVQHQQPQHGGDPRETELLHAKLRRQETQIAELQAQLHRLKRRAKTPKTTATATSLAPPMVVPVVHLMDGMKPFQCFVCYRRFANFYQLSFHAKQHPDASIADVARNQEPLPVGPKFCPESDCEYSEAAQKPLKNLQTLKRHWQRRHQLARPYVCAMCSPANAKSFKTKENLKAHEKECAKTSTRRGAAAAAAVATGIANTTHREVAEAM